MCAALLVLYHALQRTKRGSCPRLGWAACDFMWALLGTYGRSARCTTSIGAGQWRAARQQPCARAPHWQVSFMCTPADVNIRSSSLGWSWSRKYWVSWRVSVETLCPDAFWWARGTEVPQPISCGGGGAVLASASAHPHALLSVCSCLEDSGGSVTMWCGAHTPEAQSAEERSSEVPSCDS